MPSLDNESSDSLILASLTVKAGHHDRVMCPVEVTIKRDTLGDGAYDWLAAGAIDGLRLLRKDLCSEIPCQVMPPQAGVTASPGGSPGAARPTVLTDPSLDAASPKAGECDTIRVRFILDNLLAGEEEQLYLASSPSGTTSAGQSGVQLAPDDGELRISIDGEYFTSYVFDESYAKPFIGPIVGPFGHWITRLDPEIREHPHHRSIWVAIGDVNGIDTWNEPEGRYGRQLHRGFGYVVSGSVCGEFSTTNTWTTFDGSPLVDETRTVSVYKTPAWQRIIDIDIVFTASYGKVVFGRTKEAGPLGIRVAESMKVTNGGMIENSVGAISESETWGKRAHWCDYSGKVEGHHLGIAAFDHPSNSGYPTYWHVRDYGLMAPNNFYFVGPVTLEQGESVRYRYRVITHLGSAEVGKVGQRFLDYAYPPKADIAEVQIS
jgi:hypothetical protein